MLIALGVSFFCSIAEAVLLSCTTAHIFLLEQEKKKSGILLRKLKEDINSPLVAILTLNTIAHTIGAAGVGAQAVLVFGNAYLGIASAILTVLILIFSEIIPKTLGAHYWRQLATPTAYSLKFLIGTLYPFIKLSEILTRGVAHEPTLKGFSRDEFAAMAELSTKEGQLAQQELKIVKNLLLLRETIVKSAMTPSSVVFSLAENMSIEEFFQQHENVPFSRMPIYSEAKEAVSGFVLRNDLLLAKAQGHTKNKINEYKREIYTGLDSMKLTEAFDVFLRKRSHIMLIVDEYGGMKGILTLEDVLETLLGLEIVDESDKTVDMQKLASRLWKTRAKKLGLNIDEFK
tara:strand:+ start:945 stop:1979 length:1035 start_codon:yes stop_codon:yes gene_type:complete